MRAIDTNVLVRLITRDDSRQTASAESFVDKGAWVSELVLAETTWVLASVYELSSKDLATAIEMLLHHRDLVIQDSETVAGALELFRAKPALGFSDCLMLQSVPGLGITLVARTTHTAIGGKALTSRCGQRALLVDLGWVGSSRPYPRYVESD